MHARRPWPDVIRDGQAAPPLRWCDGTSDGGQEWLCIGIGNRQNGNLGEGLCLRDRQSLRILGRADAGRQRITRIYLHLHHAAALRAEARTPRPARIRVALYIAVVAGIRINEAPDCPVFGRDFGFDAAPGAEVARDHDCALDGNPHALESLVVGRHAVVHVHERSRHIAVDRIRVVRGELLILLRRRGITAYRRLAQAGDELRRGDELHDAFERRGEEHVECLDVGVETKALELAENPLGIVPVIGRAHVVGPRRQPSHVGAQRVGRRHGAELCLPLPLGIGGLGAEAAQLVDRRANGGGGNQ